jgi:hypothetical protein
VPLRDVDDPDVDDPDADDPDADGRDADGPDADGTDGTDALGCAGWAEDAAAAADSPHVVQ